MRFSFVNKFEKVEKNFSKPIDSSGLGCYTVPIQLRNLNRTGESEVANMKRYIRTDRNGTKYFEETFTCDRCGGHGYYAIAIKNGAPVLSPHDGGMCWKCMGSGKVLEVTKEYTPEHVAKLEAARIKREEKRKAEWEANEVARKAAEEARRIQAERERAERAAEQARRRGRFLGTIGDKLEIKVSYERCISFDSMYGTMFIEVFKDEAGNTLIWKTASGMKVSADKQVLTIKGTIKNHQEYNGINQTVLTRVKVIA